MKRNAKSVIFGGLVQNLLTRSGRVRLEINSVQRAFEQRRRQDDEDVHMKLQKRQTKCYEGQYEDESIVVGVGMGVRSAPNITQTGILKTLLVKADEALSFFVTFRLHGKAKWNETAMKHSQVEK